MSVLQTTDGQTSEAPVITNADNTTQANQAAQAEQGGEVNGVDAETVKSIKLDGPLSKILSHALVMLYKREDPTDGVTADENAPATERVAVTGLLHRIKKERDEVLKDDQARSVYVYSFDNKNASNQAVLDALTALDVTIASNEYSDVALVVECHGSHFRNLDPLLDFARQSKIKTYMTVKAGASALKSM